MSKLTPSESGKLGNLASKETLTNQLRLREELYFTNPKTCRQCKEILPYKKRVQECCSKECSTTMRKTKNKIFCNNCGIELNKRSQKKFCSLKCQQDSYSKLRRESNQFSHTSIKSFLLRFTDYKCSSCGISEWNSQPIVLELEHKDGNSDNNTLDNVCLICPNCHSQTDTYKGKNFGKGRHYRRVRYSEGKSY